MHGSIQRLALIAFGVHIAAALACTLQPVLAQTAPRRVAVGGEQLSARDPSPLPKTIADNLSLRSDLTARTLDPDRQQPWLTPRALAQLAPGEATVWITQSLYGTRYELVAFAVDEQGRYLGSVHRQATTRTIPGTAGRFDRIPPGPNQYFRNAAVELAADIARLLKQTPPADAQVVNLRIAADLSVNQKRLMHSFLAVLAHRLWQAQRTRLLLGTDKPLLELHLLTRGELAEDAAFAAQLRTADGTVTARVGPASKDQLLPMARRLHTHLFGGGPRILRTFAPTEKRPEPFAPEEEQAAPRPRRKRPQDALAADDWTFPLPDVITAEPVAWARRIAVGCRNGEVCALDADSGNLLWRFECADAPAALAPAGDVLLVSDRSGTLYGIDASGKAAWKRPFASPVRWQLSEPADPRAALALENGALVLIEADTGKTAAEVTPPTRLGTRPIQYEDALIATTVDGHVFRVVLSRQALEPLVALPLPPRDPPALHRDVAVRCTALDTVKTDVLAVTDTAGNLHIISLTDKHRPPVPMRIDVDLDKLDEKGTGMGTGLEVRD